MHMETSSGVRVLEAAQATAARLSRTPAHLDSAPDPIVAIVRDTLRANRIRGADSLGLQTGTDNGPTCRPHPSRGSSCCRPTAVPFP
jgi:hypothetical protein